MKHSFLSRRHRNPQQHEEAHKEQPFFSKSTDPAPQAFFAGHEQPVQAKPAMGQPGNPHEKQRDAVADHVVSAQSRSPVRGQGTTAIQRAGLAMPKEDEKPATAEARMEKDKSIQEKADERVQPAAEMEEAVRMKQDLSLPEKKHEAESDGSTASPQMAIRLQGTSGGGRSLGANIRAEMESGIGADFGEVRVHTDSSAVLMNEELGTQAFTHGRDIYFNSGKYHPESAEGKELLAHELTHVVQQGGTNRSGRDPWRKTGSDVRNNAP